MIEIINLQNIPEFIDNEKLTKIVTLIHGNVIPIIRSINAEIPLPNILINLNNNYETDFQHLADSTSDTIARTKIYYESQLQYITVMYGRFNLYKRETKYIKKNIKKIFNDDDYTNEINYFLHMLMSKCGLLEDAKNRYEIMIKACHTELVSRKSNTERYV